MPRFSGERLRAARERAGLSREQLAVLVQRSHGSIVLYEQGRSLPSVTALERLAATLDVPIGDLFATEVAA